MGKEKENDLYNSDDTELIMSEEPEDTKKEILDERDYILPLEEAGENSFDPSQKDNSSKTEVQADAEIEMPFIENDDQTETAQSELEMEIPLKDNDEQNINNEIPQDKSPKKEIAKEAIKETEGQKSAARLSSVNKVISFALIMLIVTGFIFYRNPALIGLTKAEQPATPVPVDVIEPVTPVAQPVATPSPPSKRDQCIAKLEEAGRLRNELLEKIIEISELDLNYRNGIAELEAKIYQEIKKAGIRSYEEAIKIKNLELNMRTIQRRQAYIKELTKPAYWLNSGSEELYYLIRKAQLDLQVTEIAGGIDLNKHIRHINAAIQKYRPSPDKLAVDPLQSKVQPLENIWQQVSSKKEKKKQITINSKDEIILNQICSGNYERIAELTSITPSAARCLSQIKGSDLFLNGLKTITPDAAKQLFQWPGNWICLNGIQYLSPAVAKYLFNWKGNWISLNSLDEFPPELAMFLLKWEGQQLELTSLKYNKNKANQKTLKYLALWETTGGKLFVTDKIRQEMESLM